MKKEKSVRAYQRKSKNGKVVTVHSYKAKYDAAEEARKEMAKRAGAGDELKKKKSAAPVDLGFTADEFKIWANDLDAKEAKRIDKILVKKYGEKAVQKLADEINAGNSRTHKAVFARLSSEKPVKKVATKVGKGMSSKEDGSNGSVPKTTIKRLDAMISGYEKKRDIAQKHADDGDRKAIRPGMRGVTTYREDAREYSKYVDQLNKAKQNLLNGKDKVAFNTLEGFGFTRKEVYSKKNLEEYRSGVKANKDAEKQRRTQYDAYVKESGKVKESYSGHSVAELEKFGRKMDAAQSSLKGADRKAWSAYVKTPEGKSLSRAYTRYTKDRQEASQYAWSKQRAQDDIERGQATLSKLGSNNKVSKVSGSSETGMKVTSKNMSQKSGGLSKSEFSWLTDGAKTFGTKSGQAKITQSKSGDLIMKGRMLSLGGDFFKTLKAKGFKSVDKVSVLGGADNYVSADGKTQITVHRPLEGTTSVRVHRLRSGERAGNTIESTLRSFGMQD